MSHISAIQLLYFAVAGPLFVPLTLPDQAGYAEAQLEQLGRLKAKYDPSNLLRNNVNILPVQ